MEIYLDDCADDDDLVRCLGRAGYRVRTPRTDGTSGSTDAIHLRHCAERGLTLLTKNPRDFRDLHDRYQSQGQSHSGILLVYEDNILGKDMEPPDVVRAIGNMRRSGLPIINECHVLNHWR